MSSIWSNIKLKHVLFCIFVTFVITCLVNISVINIPCNCDEKSFMTDKMSDNIERIPKSINPKKFLPHRLAIIVPFRDRFEELLAFAPHMHTFLSKQNLDFHIFVLNQIDKYRFNRASLINVGFLYIKDKFDYIAMHDVDLLPINDELLYEFPEKGPLHISSPDLHPRYHYPTFVGGILLVRREHFMFVNGMSNKYWGWGLEDDEFYVRLKEAGLKISRPKNITTGIQNTFKHNHDRNHRKRDMTKCYNQREVTRKRDRQTGLKNVSFEIKNVVPMTIEKAKLTIINIVLNCNKTITPWCECIEKNN